MLEKKTKIDKVEVVDSGDYKAIQVRTATWIEEDGQMVGSKGYHRHILMPTDDLSEQDPEIQAIANVVFTQEMKDAYALRALELENNG
jgi:hypothetical protein